MNPDIDSTERFVAQLRELKPAVPGMELQLRLEAALRETNLQPSASGKIIHHPFFQWSAAAAALLTALALSVESTEHRAGSGISQVPVEPSASPGIQRVFHLVDGKLVPAVSRTMMLQTSYRGIEVIEGKAYRKFGDGRESILELIQTAPSE